jgi:hypothetical protein
MGCLKDHLQHKVFAWLILQNRLWTTDRVVKYGGQTNSVCKLYNTKDQSALHMLIREVGVARTRVVVGDCLGTTAGEQL